MNTGALAHLQINVKAGNLPFYRELFTLLDWTPILSADWAEAFGGKGDISLWFVAAANDARNDYDGAGVNHIALAARSQAEVNATAEWLAQRAIPRLFDTPCHRPDFASNPDSTYYQVMFESPDGILFEHVYIGPKQD